MSDHAAKALSVADKVVDLVEDGLRGIGLTIGKWPPEFRAIVWDAVADIASRRAEAARAAVGAPSDPK